MSTLPWQQNFAGLIGGIVFGMGLTFVLVPFVNITKYNRKSKVSLKFRKSTCFNKLFSSDKLDLDVHSAPLARVCRYVCHFLCFSNPFLVAGLFGRSSE